MKNILIVALLLFCVSSAQADEPLPYFYADADTFYISIESGWSGRNVRQDMVTWLQNLQPLINKVNSKQGYFVAEVTNDPMMWKVLQRLLGERKISEWEFEALNPVFDGGVNTDRMSTLTGILKQGGLRVLDVRYLPSRDEVVYTKLYYEQYLQAAEAKTDTIVVVERHEVEVSAVSSPEPRQPWFIPAWGLGTKFGLEGLSSKVDITPSAAVTILHYRTMVEFFGGHSVWTTERSVLTDDDQTLNRYFGMRVGHAVVEPVWLYIGWRQEENLVWTPRAYRDNRLYRFRGAEAGLALVYDHLTITASGLYGNEKNFGSDSDNVLNLRCSVLVGNVWGW